MSKRNKMQAQNRLNKSKKHQISFRDTKDIKDIRIPHRTSLTKFEEFLFCDPAKVMKQKLDEKVSRGDDGSKSQTATFRNTMYSHIESKYFEIHEDNKGSPDKKLTLSPRYEFDVLDDQRRPSQHYDSKHPPFEQLETKRGLLL